MEKHTVDGTATTRAVKPGGGDLARVGRCPDRPGSAHPFPPVKEGTVDGICSYRHALQRHFRYAAGCSPPHVLGRAFGDDPGRRSATSAVDLVARATGLQMPIAARPWKVTALGTSVADYPGEMLAFIRKKFVGSYLALRAVSRIHCSSL